MHLGTNRVLELRTEGLGDRLCEAAAGQNFWLAPGAEPQWLIIRQATINPAPLPAPPPRPTNSHGRVEGTGAAYAAAHRGP